MRTSSKETTKTTGMVTTAGTATRLVGGLLLEAVDDGLRVIALRLQLLDRRRVRAHRLLQVLHLRSRHQQL
jgi:hypothetical protein